ncbi:MAG: murein L,D-transpeptidase [Polyangiaceae bacterium]|nr:murein L,D-transpeptidase [Polyangiaceae bacterium]
MRLRRTVRPLATILFLATLIWAVPALGSSNSRAALAATNAQRRIGDALTKKGLSFGSPVYLRVFKEEAEIEVWLKNGERYDLFKTFPICASSGALGPKEKAGDKQSPEGFYGFTRSKLNPASRFHLSFDVGYPNAYDKSLGRTGSAIMVHGDCVSIGCFAMTDAGIEDIYSLVDAAFKKGQKSIAVHVFPFRMTGAKMKAHADSKWASFWSELKAGYDAFETTHTPPTVAAEGGHYSVR